MVSNALRALLVVLVVAMLWLHVGTLLTEQPEPLGVALAIALTATTYTVAMRLWYLGWTAR